MDSVPISSGFQICGPADQIQQWDAIIQKLKADEEKHPENTAIDERDISYYEQLKANRQELLDLAAAYRASNNDPVLQQKITILSGRQETLNQLLELDSYIKDLEADTKKHPQNAGINAQKIAIAQQQAECIQKFQTAWETYQQSGSSADGEKVNALIKELQGLRRLDPTSPFSQDLIWQDREVVVSQYMILNFNGHYYAVSP